jgi:hypothetical protein
MFAPVVISTVPTSVAPAMRIAAIAMISMIFKKINPCSGPVDNVRNFPDGQ